MISQLSVTTAIALRAAVAATLAIIVGHLLPLERAYWAVLVAVVLMSESWGASIQKAAQRVGMTALGLPAGLALHWLARSYPQLETFLLLVFVFLAVASRRIYGRGSYPLMILFISIYVVFLFAVLGEWNTALLKIRLIDTAVGSIVALLATVLIRPSRAGATLRTEWDRVRQVSQRHLDEAFDQLLHSSQPSSESPPHEELLRIFEDLRARASEANYETFFQHLSQQEYRALAEQGQSLGRHVLALLDAVESARSSGHHESPRFRQIVARLHQDVVTFEQNGAGSNSGQVTDLCRQTLDILHADPLEPADLIRFAPIVYYSLLVRQDLERASTTVRQPELASP